MPSDPKNRLSLVVSDVIRDELERYAAKHGMSSTKEAALDWLAIAYESVTHQPPPKIKPKHGGQRYYQCKQCSGWNIGYSGDGIKRCSDCGWDSTEEAPV